MQETDPLPKLVKDYRDATFLESIATNPKDKKRFNVIRNFLYLALAAYLAQVTWH